MLVLPGRAPTTRFGDNGRARMTGAEVPEAYAELAQGLFASWAVPGPVTEAADVAKAIWWAATETGSPARIPAGADAAALAIAGF